MRYVKDYGQFVNEAKQVGILYHYTSFKAANLIIKSGGIKSGSSDVLGGYSGINASNKNSISFTRNKNFHKTYREISTLVPDCRFVIDGNALSNKYKIQPIAAWGYEKSQGEKFEAEEVILSSAPFTVPLKKYVISIDVLYDPVESFDVDGYKFLETLRQLESQGIKINVVDENGDPVPSQLKLTLFQRLKKPFKKMGRVIGGFPTESTTKEPNYLEDLNEKKPYHASKIMVFDLDDTLVITDAKIKVYDKLTGDSYSLTPEEFNEYEQQPHHEVDFNDFKSLEIMKAGKLIEYYLKIFKEAYALKIAVGIVTARDDREMIYKWLREHVGFRIDKDLIFAVNDPVHQFKGSVSDRKKQAFKQLIDMGYKDLQFYDDDTANLVLVKSLENEYEDVNISTIKANKKFSIR